MMSYLRMAPWLLVAAALYFTALNIAQPQMQTLLWKLGHITLGANLGYWIDRTAFRDRYDASKPDPMRALSRAIIMAAAMLGISLGL